MEVRYNDIVITCTHELTVTAVTSSVGTLYELGLASVPDRDRNNEEMN